ATSENVMLVLEQLTSLRPVFLFKKAFKNICASSNHSRLAGTARLQDPSRWSRIHSERGAHERPGRQHAGPSGCPFPALLRRPPSSFVACFDFLSRYCLLVEQAEWAVIWPRLIEFVRELAH